ncbi:unnamed protein product [Amoebophrya sp. A120]|nr:unnamed protein product [Amoebophrya sp. A120]|eukprot:GSA120T00006226001.1
MRFLSFHFHVNYRFLHAVSLFLAIQQAHSAAPRTRSVLRQEASSVFDSDVAAQEDVARPSLTASGRLNLSSGRLKLEQGEGGVSRPAIASCALARADRGSALQRLRAPDLDEEFEDTWKDNVGTTKHHALLIARGKSMADIRSGAEDDQDHAEGGEDVFSEERTSFFPEETTDCQSTCSEASEAAEGQGSCSQFFRDQRKGCNKAMLALSKAAFVLSLLGGGAVSLGYVSRSSSHVDDFISGVNSAEAPDKNFSAAGSGSASTRGEAVERTATILALGDSITEGFWLDPATGGVPEKWCLAEALWVNRLARKLNMGAGTKPLEKPRRPLPSDHAAGEEPRHGFAPWNGRENAQENFFQVCNAGNSGGLSTILTGRAPTGGIAPKNASPHATLVKQLGKNKTGTTRVAGRVSARSMTSQNKSSLLEQILATFIARKKNEGDQDDDYIFYLTVLFFGTNEVNGSFHPDAPNKNWFSRKKDTRDLIDNMKYIIGKVTPLSKYFVLVFPYSPKPAWINNVQLAWPDGRDKNFARYKTELRDFVKHKVDNGRCIDLAEDSVPLRTTPTAHSSEVTSTQEAVTALGPPAPASPAGVLSSSSSLAKPLPNFAAFAKDLLHPNALGHKIIGELVYGALEQLVKQRHVKKTKRHKVLLRGKKSAQSEMREVVI